MHLMDNSSYVLIIKDMVILLTRQKKTLYDTPECSDLGILQYSWQRSWRHAHPLPEIGMSLVILSIALLNLTVMGSKAGLGKSLSGSSCSGHIFDEMDLE